jgi:hypothetical protein
LVEELLQLWSKEGVSMWDEHERQDFNLRALLFVTINDWPALSNLSGQTNKGYIACTHCIDDTDNIYLKHCKKVVYMENRRFLPKNHPLRRSGSHCNHFNGEPNHRSKPINRNGAHIFAAEVVRLALTQLERETRHIFPDYHYFKLKALDYNKLDVTQIPKRVYPQYELESVSVYDMFFISCVTHNTGYAAPNKYLCKQDDYYNGYMHTKWSLCDVLTRVVGPLGYTVTGIHYHRVQGGFQAEITLTTPSNSV